MISVFLLPSPQWFLSLHVSESKGPSRGNALGPPNEWDNNFISLWSLFCSLTRFYFLLWRCCWWCLICIVHSKCVFPLKSLSLMQCETGTNERSFSFLGAYYGLLQSYSYLMPFLTVLWTGWSYFRNGPISEKKKANKQTKKPRTDMKASKYMPVICTLAWRWDKSWEFLPNLSQALWLQIVQC